MSIMERLIDARKSTAAKVIAVVLSIALIISLANISAFAEGDGYSGEFAPVEQEITQVSIELNHATLTYDGKQFNEDGTIPVKDPENFTIKIVAEEGYELSTVEALTKDETGTVRETELSKGSTDEYVVPAGLVSSSLTIRASTAAIPQTDAEESTTTESKGQVESIQSVNNTQVSSLAKMNEEDENVVNDSDDNLEPADSNKFIPIEELYLIPSKYLVSVEDTFTVKSYLEPSDATVDHVEWSITQGSAKVVSADKKQAEIQATSTGVLEVTAKVYTSVEEYEEAKVIVTVDPIAVSSVKISGYDKDYLLAGETLSLNATVEPDNAADKKVTWKSSDPSIVAVNENGGVVAKSQGKATITAITENGKYDSVEITVYNQAPKQVTFQVWNTNRNQHHDCTALIPSDGTEVSAAQLLPNIITVNDKKFVFNNMLRVDTRRDKDGQPSWPDIQNSNNSWESFEALRVENGRIQYKNNDYGWPLSGFNWKNLGSDNLCAFCDLVHEGAVKDSNDLAVILGDWPYGDNESTNQTKKQIQIKVVDTERNARIYDSGNMRYSDGSNGDYGKIKFNCLDSIYQVKNVTVKKNNNGEEDANYNPETGVSVHFSSNGENEHYVVTAYVEARQFDVSYDLNGADTQVGFDSYKVKPINNARVVVSNQTPERANYVFAGWQFDGTTYMPGESFTMPTKDVVFKANWEPASEAIAYSAEEGGKVTRTFERVTTSKQEAKGSVAQANPGYAFIGWYDGDTLVSAENTFKPEYKAGKYVAKFVPVNVTVSGYTGVYDGEDHTVNVENGLPDFIKNKVEIQYSEDDATWSNTNPTYKNVKKGTDGEVVAYTVHARAVLKLARSVDEGLVIWQGKADVTIEPREVIVTADSAEKEFDGTALTKNTYKIADSTQAEGDNPATGLVGSDKIESVAVEGSQVYPGESDNVASNAQFSNGVNANNYMVIYNPGTLKITDRTTPYTVGIEANSLTETYDGTEKSVSGFKNECDFIIGMREDAKTVKAVPVTIGANENAQTYYVVGLTSKAEGIDVKDSQKIIEVTGTPQIYSEAGDDVTKQFTVSVTPGSLTINKANVTIKTDSASRVYNGQPLKASGAIEGIVERDKGSVEFKVTGSRTEVGSSENSYELNWNKASDDNYQVKEELGRLTVSAQSIDPNAPSEDPNDPAYKGVQVETLADVVYNGQIQAQKPAVKVSNAADATTLVEGTDYDVSFGDSNTTNVGDITVTVTGKGNYAGNVIRTYKITPAPLTVTTPSATKTFDGAALTNTAGTLEGLQGNDSVNFTVTGSQTAVGNSVNTYAIDWSNALANNYAITESLGTLSVTAAPVNPATPDNPNPPTPGTPTNPTPNPGVTPTTPTPAPAPAPAGPAAPAATPAATPAAPAPAAAPAATATITDDGTPLAAGETIDDEDTPLAAFDHVDCWVHWIILIGIILTAIYGAVVVRRRLAVVKDVDDLEDEVLEGATVGATQSAPSDNRQAI